VPRFPRAAVLRSRIAEREKDFGLALELLRGALRAAPKLLPDELPRVLGMVPAGGQDALLGELAAMVEAADVGGLRRLVLAAVAAGIGASADGPSAALQLCIEKVLAADLTLGAVWGSDEARPQRTRRFAVEMRALLAAADKYRCTECGFSGRTFYWHCPACHAWESFEACAIVKLD
jgi:lipopolysaccharide biosynthesis regulator YciM